MPDHGVIENGRYLAHNDSPCLTSHHQTWMGIMKNSLLLVALISITLTTVSQAATLLEIDIVHEIDLGDGTYLAQEYGGQNRYAFISHSHGRFEGGDIAEANCTDGFVVTQLPAKFGKIKKAFKPTDYVLTTCQEAN